MLGLMVVLLLPCAGATTIRFQGEQDLHQEVRPSIHGTIFTFRASVAFNGEHEAYFKVVPSPSNRAFGNGTADKGWWTTVTLQEQGRSIIKAEGNGSAVLPLGPIANATLYQLRLDVRVPPGALADVGEIRLRYVVAVKATSGTGSGGQMDPSLAINPVILVSETARQEVRPMGEDASFPLPTLAVALLVLVGLGLGTWKTIQKRKRRSS